MPETKAKAGPDEVVIGKADLQTLLKRVTELEKGVTGSKAIDLEEPTVRSIRVRMFKDKPVSFLSNVTSTGRYNPNGNEVMDVDVYGAENTPVVGLGAVNTKTGEQYVVKAVQGEDVLLANARTGRDEEVSLTALDNIAFSMARVDYVNFLATAPSVECIIASRESVKRVVENGTPVEVTAVEGYKTLGTGVKIRQTVTYYDDTYTVKLPDGTTAVIKNPNI